MELRIDDKKKKLDFSSILESINLNLVLEHHVNEKEESFTKPFFRSSTNIYIRTCIFLKRYVKELKEHLNRSIDRPSNNSFHALHPALDSIFHPVRANSARALQQRASKKSIIARGPRAKWNKIGYLFIYGRGTWAKVLAHGYR